MTYFRSIRMRKAVVSAKKWVIDYKKDAKSTYFHHILKNRAVCHSPFRKA